MEVRQMLKKKITIFYIVVTIFILDRLSKYIILELSNPIGKLNVPITSFLNFDLIWNNGIAFGLFSFNEVLYYNLITLIIIIISLIILLLAFKSKGIERVSYSMIFGGSLGNLFDRLYYSAVIDFIDLNINNIHWFIFNIADIFITLGVIMLITLEFFDRKKI
jgi:signal peptidase II